MAVELEIVLLRQKWIKIKKCFEVLHSHGPALLLLRKLEMVETWAVLVSLQALHPQDELDWVLQTPEFRTLGLSCRHIVL